MSKAWIRIGAVAAVVVGTLLLVEVGLRVLVGTNEQTGLRVIGRVPLLPWRASEAHVRKTLGAPEAEGQYIGRDPDLGWSIRPNGKGGLYEANASGFRGRPGEVVAPTPAPGITRVAIYGDSFTHGDEVGNDDTWASRWMRVRPKLEVLNFGVPGYGVDQAVLRFERDGARFGASVHLLCIWPEDIIRNLNVIRFYMTPHGNLGPAKPRFVMGGSGLELVNHPVMGEAEYVATVTGQAPGAVMRHDRLYAEDDVARRWHHVSYVSRTVGGLLRTYERRREREAQYFSPDSEANRLVGEIARRFKARAEAGGARAYVVIIPAADMLDRHVGGGWPMVGAMKAAGVDVIDLGAAIAEAARVDGLDKLYRGHTTPLGNQRVAEALDRALKERKVPGFD